MKLNSLDVLSDEFVSRETESQCAGAGEVENVVLVE
jgi:hypothetical protein